MGYKQQPIRAIDRQTSDIHVVQVLNDIVQLAYFRIFDVLGKIRYHTHL